MVDPVCNGFIEAWHYSPKRRPAQPRMRLLAVAQEGIWSPPSYQPPERILFLFVLT
jgi:hypothetical protein